MNKYSITKKGIKRKLDYFLKKSNLSIKDLQILSIKEIYKLLKMLSSFDSNFKFKRKELKKISISLFEYSNNNSINDSIEKIIKLEKINFSIQREKNIFNRIFFNYFYYFFDRKQIIRC